MNRRFVVWILTIIWKVSFVFKWGECVVKISLSDVQLLMLFCSILLYCKALYFSLSTMATIGYGTSDYYFGECWTPFILVLLQVFSAIVFSSLAIGLLFQRMSRGQKRGRTIVFSDVAVIRKVRGRYVYVFFLNGYSFKFHMCIFHVVHLISLISSMHTCIDGILCFDWQS